MNQLSSLTTILVVIAILLTANISHTEQINIPIGTQGDTIDNAIILPKRGETLTTVIKQWGEPVSLGEPIGEPPIRKATYAGFSVVFENDLVIHTVLTHTASKLEQ